VQPPRPMATIVIMNETEVCRRKGLAIFDTTCKEGLQASPSHWLVGSTSRCLGP
jgi:hypothetical protein